ncbi:MAG: hypothetical protein KAX20_01125, partial [Candidatus Omnitrophica bacterium]|nr:hypothetical protein [Candidatus Omnitrophota bacterium]
HNKEIIPAIGPLIEEQHKDPDGPAAWALVKIGENNTDSFIKEIKEIKGKLYNEDQIKELLSKGGIEGKEITRFFKLIDEPSPAPGEEEGNQSAGRPSVALNLQQIEVRKEPKIYTPGYIEEIKKRKYKKLSSRHKRGGATWPGRNIETIKIVADKLFEMYPDRTEFTGIVFGLGSISKDPLNPQPGTEPYELMAYFRSKGKKLTLKAFDIDPDIIQHYKDFRGRILLKKYLASLGFRDDQELKEYLDLLKKGFGVEIEDRDIFDEEGSDQSFYKIPVPEEIQGDIEFSVMDIMRSEELQGNYDLIFALGVFQYLSPKHNETKDHVLYQLIQHLNPDGGLIAFNDRMVSKKSKRKQWVNVLRERIQDLGVHDLSGGVKNADRDQKGGRIEHFLLQSAKEPSSILTETKGKSIEDSKKDPEKDVKEKNQDDTSIQSPEEQLRYLRKHLPKEEYNELIQRGDPSEVWESYLRKYLEENLHDVYTERKRTGQDTISKLEELYISTRELSNLGDYEK